ncbi:hypothetical protein BD769DRAFT_1397235 [Suillus cothurnatus]|nr:hypothetical protein BD769DRAFT_1397235 [Suillus cothurnatus]
MSVYEPDMVCKLLSMLEPKDMQKKFKANWKDMDILNTQPIQDPDASVNGKLKLLMKALTQPCLDSRIPILGPHFLPPSYLHVQKRNQSEPAINPEVLYLKPLRIIHPFYHPELARCPQCDCADSVSWDGWTGTGPWDVHGLMFDEAVIGIQLRCESCRNDPTKRRTSRDTASQQQTQTSGTIDPTGPFQMRHYLQAI